LIISSIHVRRGDKIGSEALGHSVDKYMFHVVNYFNKLSLNDYSGEKVVFVATDEENVMQKLNHKYPDFKFIDKKQFFQTNYNQFSEFNLLDTIFDVQFLSKSDFIVCTMSSNVRISKIFGKIIVFENM